MYQLHVNLVKLCCVGCCQEDLHGRQLAQRLASAPASLAASRESLLEMMTSSRASTPSTVHDINKRFSADLSHLQHVDVMAQGHPAVAVRGHPAGVLEVIFCIIALCSVDVKPIRTMNCFN